VFAGGSGMAGGVRESGLGWQPGRGLIGALLLLVVSVVVPACAELKVLAGATGGAGPPPSGSLSVSFIDVGQGDGVLVQTAGQSYLIDAGRPEVGPNVVDFLRSRGVDSLDGIVVTNPRN
jgi:competence protein ComEC